MKKSIILRGSISYDRHPHNFLENIVKSIRDWFDGELIISTWNGQENNISPFLDVDKIIFNEDPGPGPIQHWKRQVVSAIEGFKVSTGDAIMISRPDIIFKKDVFQYLNLYPKSKEVFKIFDHKLVIPNMMTLRPDGGEKPEYFRVSDWAHIGYREDILKWIDILEHIENFDHSKHNTDSVGICTEVCWFLSALKNRFGDEINIHDCNSIKHNALEAIMNNFIVLDSRSTMGAYNMNWDFQPEYLPCYFDENFYKKLYEQMFGNENG